MRSGDKLKVHDDGRLTDGTKFDSPRDRSRPFACTIGKGSVIKPWEIGLIGMKVGGHRTLTISPGLAYGDKAMPPKIPAKSTLIFDVELLDVTPAAP